MNPHIIEELGITEEQAIKLQDILSLNFKINVENILESENSMFEICRIIMSHIPKEFTPEKRTAEVQRYLKILNESAGTNITLENITKALISEEKK